MLNLNVSNVQYQYQTPISFGKSKKAKEELLDPEVKAFYATQKLYKKEEGTIGCAPYEVQDFYKEAMSDIGDAKKNLYALKLNEKTILNKIAREVENLYLTAKSGQHPENAKFERTENGFIYKEYDGKYIAREIVKTGSKIKFSKAEGNNKKTITICNISTDKETGKILISNIKHTNGYHKTGLGAISYDREYIFEKNTLKQFTQNYSSDGRGNDRADLSIELSATGNVCIANKKNIAGEGCFCDKVTIFDSNGTATCHIKNLINDTDAVRTTEKELYFKDNQPIEYISEGIKKGASQDNQRYAKFTGASWCYM